MAEFANTTNSSILSTSSYNHTTPSGTKSPDESTITLVLITYVGLLVGIIFFALLGNVLVILVFLFDKRLRVSTSYYMLSLAVSDVITAAIVMPLELDQVLNGYKWRHSQVLCQTWTTAYLFTVPVSILTSCVSSIDRWYAITRPLKYRTGRTGLKRKALCAILLVWVYSVFFALIPKMGWNPGYIAQGIFPEDTCIFDIKEDYSILSSALNFILPSFFTAVFYYNMFAVMKRHTRTRRKLSSCSEYSQRNPSPKGTDRMNFMRNASLAKSFALIGSLLIITWCPFTLISIVRNVCNLLKTEACSAVINMNPNIEYGFLMLGYFNSAINPVVYVLRFKAFRATIRNWFLCRKRSLGFQ